ncbi:two-partner secretion domain-containing protein, partial [Burkholderia orbicola]|uniref:two-partner secretion domain-containing protein n=1 Tax=Burkholderia orbicola TaxID=2978683 RepID=UPI0026547C18
MKKYLLSLFDFFLRRRSAPSVTPSRLLLALFSRVVLVAASGNALAVGTGQVVQGEAIIQGGNGALATVINQTTDRAVINWSNFNIGQNESVTFNQLGATSATLNQVVGNSVGPTLIEGALKANGRVFIVDHNGVVFGDGAQVNVGGLVASSLHIDPLKFLSDPGVIDFSGQGVCRGAGDGCGPVRVAKGAQITAKEFVALLSESTVANSGKISVGENSDGTQRGIAMVAADVVNLSLDGMIVTVDRPALDAMVVNDGELVVAESRGNGSIVLNAAGRNALMGSLLSAADREVLKSNDHSNLINSGVIENNSLGGVTLTAATADYVRDSKTGRISVGGRVKASDKIDIDGRVIELSGDITAGELNAGTPASVNVGGENTFLVSQDRASRIKVGGDGPVIYMRARSFDLRGDVQALGGRVVWDALGRHTLERVTPIVGEDQYLFDGRAVRRTLFFGSGGDIGDNYFYDPKAGEFLRINGGAGGVADIGSIMRAVGGGEDCGGGRCFRLVVVNGRQYIARTSRADANAEGRGVDGDPESPYSKNNLVLVDPFSGGDSDRRAVPVLGGAVSNLGSRFIVEYMGAESERDARLVIRWADGPRGVSDWSHGANFARFNRPMQLSVESVDLVTGQVTLDGGIKLESIDLVAGEKLNKGHLRYANPLTMTVRDAQGNIWVSRQIISSLIPISKGASFSHWEFSSRAIIQLPDGRIVLADPRNGMPLGSVQDKNDTAEVYAKIAGVAKWDQGGVGVDSEGHRISVPGMVTHDKHQVYLQLRTQSGIEQDVPSVSGAGGGAITGMTPSNIVFVDGETNQVVVDSLIDSASGANVLAGQAPVGDIGERAQDALVAAQQAVAQELAKPAYAGVRDRLKGASFPSVEVLKNTVAVLAQRDIADQMQAADIEFKKANYDDVRARLTGARFANVEMLKRTVADLRQYDGDVHASSAAQQAAQQAVAQELAKPAYAGVRDRLKGASFPSVEVLKNTVAVLAQ